MSNIPSIDSVIHLFNQAILDFHADQNGTNVFFHAEKLLTKITEPILPRELSELLYAKAWVDTVQWHLEDEIRQENINPTIALQIKRNIDKFNQYRTDLVEALEENYASIFHGIKAKPDARINTETLGWALDRLSILCLKIYHMHIESTRPEQSSQLKINCQQQYQILCRQQTILAQAITTLIQDIQIGKAHFHTYKQMKMYNDPNLNPILYQKKT